MEQGSLFSDPEPQTPDLARVKAIEWQIRTLVLHGNWSLASYYRKFGRVQGVSAFCAACERLGLQVGEIIK